MSLNQEADEMKIIQTSNENYQFFEEDDNLLEPYQSGSFLFDTFIIDLNFTSSSSNDYTPQSQIPKIMPFEEFCKYIYSKIDPDNAILITCKMLFNIEKAFIKDFEKEWIKLSRNDKRKKERIMRGLYKNANIIYKSIEENPTKYLRYTRELIYRNYANQKEKI